MTKKEFQLLNAVRLSGVGSYRTLSEKSETSLGYISNKMKVFFEEGMIDDAGITEKGKKALLPYKVDNAIIMAAGMSSRFVPISLEKPKGLLTVKGEVLIERQIEQLQSAGIKEIIVVLGYKKEAFFYLENKYDGIKLIINPEYNTKNNTHTIYMAKDYVHNTYICSSDDYFVNNPFEEYVYQSYYAAQHVTEKTNEWYMYPDAKGNISKVEKGGQEGDIMLGHAYWNRDFSEVMLKYLDRSHETGEYEQELWEQILLERTKKLPPMEIKVYPKEEIFEFDSLDELRAFDDQYVNNTHSKIMQNICNTLGCEEGEVTNFKVINKGPSYSSFIFDLRGKKYTYKQAEEDTEESVKYGYEAEALRMAQSIGLERSCVYFDESQGWKISVYNDAFRMPDYNCARDSKNVAEALRKLHESNLPVERDFKPWEEACRIEEILCKEDEGIEDRDFYILKNDVERCHEIIKVEGKERFLCHCAPFAANWIMTESGEAMLINWEHAGNAIPGYDIGTYIMDSMWGFDKAKSFIKEYYRDDYSEKIATYCFACTAVVAYYWYLWALHREAKGQNMGEKTYNWSVMARRYSNCLAEIYSP